MAGQCVALGSINPSEKTRLGSMLAAGRLTATITSKKTGQHITVCFSSTVKNEQGSPKWKHVPFSEATHVWINGVGSRDKRDKIGCFYPKTGKFYPNRLADPARCWAAEKILLAADLRAGIEIREQGSGMYWTEVLEGSTWTLVSSNECGMCGRELTDPESVRRGIGPVCCDKETGSQHQIKQRPQVPVQTSIPVAQAPTFMAHREYQRGSLEPVGEVAVQVLQEAANGNGSSKGRHVPRTFAELAAGLKS